eukprot:Skav207776  [mRNA]  locus=scaffold2087:229741:231356:- [translate_table: standard]
MNRLLGGFNTGLSDQRERMMLDDIGLMLDDPGSERIEGERHRLLHGNAVPSPEMLRLNAQASKALPPISQLEVKSLAQTPSSDAGGKIAVYV